jgi:HlyD family secretion protein
MKRALIVLIIIAAIGAGAGAYYMAHSGPQIAVATAPITRADVIDAVASTGTLQPVISVTVGSQVSGNIAWLGADFNSIVKKNQIIAKLDPTLFEAAVAQAKAQVAQSEANHSNTKAMLIKDQANLSYQTVTYKRDVELGKRNLITADQQDQAKALVDQATASIELDKAAIEQSEAAVSQAKAQLNQSQTNLEHSIITSPIDGIVTSRSVDIGQTVQASMTAPTLFIIAEDLTQMQVSANIDESDVGRITPGQDVTFRVDAFAGVDFHGTVAQIRLNPTVVNNVTTYATMLSVPNKDLRLKPGMTANLKIQVTKRSDVLRIPNTALRFRPSLDAFAALNEPVPPEALGGGRGRRGQGGQGAGGQGGQGAGGQSGQSAGGQNGPGGSGGARGDKAGSAPAASGRSGRGPGGGSDNPDRQARAMERFKSMSPDEQTQFIARMKDRGQDTAAFEALVGGKGGEKKAPATARTGFVYTPRYGSPQSGETIDSLFKPLPVAQSTGRAWVFVDHQLKPVTIRLGITDGTYTELVGGDLQEESEVVTGITGVGSARTTAAAAAGNPLLGQQQNQRGGGPGGFGGGGGNRGGR